MNRPFQGNPHLGIKRTWHDPHEGDAKAVLEVTQDVTRIVEANKAAFNMYDERSRYGSGEFHRKMSIPISIWFQLQREHRLPDQDRASFKRWANDPDNRVFHTRPGRI